MRQLITDAVRQKLDGGQVESKPLMKLAGRLKHLKSETARINRLIEEEFEQLQRETDE